MVRPSRASGTRWEDIDLINNLWIIPADRMKAKREHIVPISNQVIEIIDLMKQMSAHREYLFPSRKNPKQPMNSQSANAALKRLDFGGKLVAHRLRAKASTAMNEASSILMLLNQLLLIMIKTKCAELKTVQHILNKELH